MSVPHHDSSHSGKSLQRLEVVLVRGSIVAASVAAVLIAPQLAAQGNLKEEQAVVVPESAMPPAGMCRLWLRDVPERQQPAPTDCATALRTRPRTAILLFGDLTTEAEQPPARRSASPANASARSMFEEPSGRSSLFRAVDLRVMVGTMSPSQAMRAAEALRAAQVPVEVGKAVDQTKAAAVKRPVPPPQ